MIVKKTAKGRGFTLIELLIVIAIIALLMAILVPALSRAKEMGKRAVCLNQIKQLQFAWGLYSDDSDDKVVSGDTIYSWGFPASGGGPQGSWFEYPHQWNPVCPLKTVGTLPSSPGTAPYIPIDSAKQDDWYHSIEDGKLWKYLKDHNIYRCPVGEKNAYVTNYMSHAMHTHPQSPGPGAPMVLRKSQIKKISDRFIFLDVGWVKGGGGAYYTPFKAGGGTPSPKKWYDPPPTRHGMGTTFAFADNHSEYRKWTDKHAVEATKHGWGAYTEDNCDCDLRWFSKATWGELSSDWTSCTTRRCGD